MSKTVRHLLPSQQVTVKAYNELLDLVLSERIACVGPGISMSRTAAGIALNVDNALLKSRRTEATNNTENAADTNSWFFAKISAVEIFDSKSPQSVSPTDPTKHINVYQYTFVQVYRWGVMEPKPYPYKTAWRTLDGGISGTCYNLIELNNPGYVASVDTSTSPPIATGTWGEGLHGNGVDTTGSIANTSMTIQPIPVGTIVVIFPILVKKMQGNVTEYYCQYENGVDGSC